MKATLAARGSPATIELGACRETAGDVGDAAKAEKTQGRVPHWRNLLQLEVGPNHHRKLAQSLQHQAPTLCAWLSPPGTACDRTKARPSRHHELTSQCVWYKKSVRPPGRALSRSPSIRSLRNRRRHLPTYARGRQAHFSAPQDDSATF